MTIKNLEITEWIKVKKTNLSEVLLEKTQLFYEIRDGPSGPPRCTLG